MALTETWLNSSVFTSEVVNNQYITYRADRDLCATNKSRGGGVLLSVHQRFKSSRIMFQRGDLLPHIDIVGVRVSFDYFLMLVFVVYVPPPITLNDLDNLFEFFLSIDNIFGKNIIILGDFNLTSYSKFVDEGIDDNYTRALNYFLSYMNLKQANSVKNSNQRILDLILHNNKNCVVEAAPDVLLKEDGHHPALAVSLEYSHSINRKQDFVIDLENNYNFRKANFPQMYNMFLNLDWSFLASEKDVDCACTLFYNKLFEILDLCVPRYKRIPKKKYPPWFTRDIILNIKKKDMYHKKYKRTGSSQYLQTFRDLRAQIKGDIEISYSNYILRIELDIKSDPKKFWAFIKNKRETSGIPNSMCFNNQELNNPRDILNSFANFFEQSFTDPDINVLEDNSIFCTQNINISCFSEIDVMNALKKITSKFTAGPDRIPAFLIHDCRFVLVKPLQLIFNMCLKQQKVPLVWKNSKVCPVFKKGDRSDISNYRPVSIICNFCKVFEFLLHDFIFPLVRGQIIPNQHGFFKGRSTSTNLLSITHDIAESIDQGLQTDVLYLDFSKAFDRLDHNVLISKLNVFGFSDSLINLFKSYLNNRQQYVALSGCTSDHYIANSGVPQGSVLGPLFFNLFINDIGLELEVDYLLYADDIKIYKRIKSIEDCVTLQNNLDIIYTWCLKNNLQLNIEKCKLVSFTNKLTVIKYDYSLGNKIISRSDSFCDLGVMFDSKLSFVSHINNVIGEALRNYGFIVRCTRDFNDIEVLKTLYNSYVRSRLEYASVVWAPEYNVHIESIERVQRKFLKYVSFKSDGIYPVQGVPQSQLLDRFKYASLRDRRDYRYLITLFNILNNNIDCMDIISKFNFYVPRINSRHNASFYLPVPRTNVLKYSPIFAMCKKYNERHDLDFFNDTIGSAKRLLRH